MSNRDKLKEWDQLKTKEMYYFFYRITKMLSGNNILALSNLLIKISVIKGV